MINFSPQVPDVAPTLSTLTDMLQLLADPVAAKNRIAEMQASTAALQQAVVEHKASTAAFTLREADHRAALEKQAADAAEKLAAAQTAFAEECQKRKEQLDDREARLIDLQAQATSDAKDAAAAKATYEKKLAIIKSAM